MAISALIHQWLELDQDPTTRSEIQHLTTNDDENELKARLSTRISFGTAGLRAKAEAGFSRMNCLTVIQTSQGLAQHLIDTKPELVNNGVVIGYDGRRDSRRFAEVAAAAFDAYGFPIIWFDDLAHTPLVPFTVKTKGAAAGIVITASHNPKQDNGYKVYGSNGCQINTPEDSQIAASIDQNLIPKTWKIPSLTDYRDAMTQAYCDSLKPIVTAKSFPRFVYTPMHGVGHYVMRRALTEIFTADELVSKRIFNPVPSQVDPDPEFPTVTFPNPEEYGALDLAKEHADGLGIDLIIANDPDADRLAVAQRVGSSWHQFKGDEVGALLGHYISRTQSSASESEPIMLTSAVSSEMLAVIGKSKGFQVVETLTGFKWIGNEALKIGKQAVFGYEEALGYMLPDIVHDKDGVAAAMTFLQACSDWGKPPYEVLQELYSKYGYFDTANTYFKSPDIPTTKGTFDAIRANPMAVARDFGEPTHCRVRDLTVGTDTGAGSGVASLPSSPDNLMITLWLTDNPLLYEGVKCTVRASGTEPKIKLYIECQSKSSLSEAKTGALRVLKAVRKQWFQDPSLKMEERYELETRP